MQVESRKKTAEKWFFLACVSYRLVEKIHRPLINRFSTTKCK
jgi:hypothetical protein